MAKVLETIFSIHGQVDGSLLSAIRTAQGALSGLNRATRQGDVSRRGQLGYLMAKYNELQKLQTNIEKLRRLETQAGEAARRNLAGQKQQSELRKEYESVSKAAERLRERLREVEQLKAQARTREEKTRADNAYRAAQADYRAQLSLKTQAYAAMKLGDLRTQTLSAAYQRQQAALRQLQNELSKAGLSIQNLGAAQERLGERIAATTNQMRKQAQTMYAAAHAAMTNAGINFNASWDNMSNAVATAQSVMSPVVTTTQTAMNYEAEISRSRALTQMDNINAGLTSVIEAEMNVLDERYKEIGRTTQFSAIEAAKAGNYLAMAGWKAQEIDSGLTPMVQLAIASGTDIARTADIFSNIVSSMRLEKTAAETQRVADRTTYLLTHSNQTLTMLDDTMKYVAPVASMLNVDIDDVYAAQKFIADAGIRGSMAGTAMKSLLLRSVAPPKKAMEALAQAGFMTPEEMSQNAAFQELMEAEGINVNNRLEGESMLMSLIRQYSEKSADWDQARKTAFIEAWAGKYATPGVAAMMDAGGYDNIKAFYEEMRSSNGAAAQTAGIMADNVKGSVISLQSAFESLQISAGDAFLPVVRPMIEGLTDLTRGLSKFAADNPAVIRGLGMIASTAAAAAVGLGAFRVALSGLNFIKTSMELLRATAALRALSAGATASGGILGMLGGALKGIGTAVLTAGRAMVMTPWGMALTGLSVAAAAIYANWDKVGPYFERLWSGIKSTFSSAASALQPYIDKIMEPFERQKELEMRATLKEELTEKVGGAINIKGEQLDEATRATRAILRQSDGKSDEAIADEIWSRLSSEKQTDESQVALKGMLQRELSVLSEESRTAIETRLNERMYESKVSTVESVRRTLEEATRGADLKTDVGRRSYLATTKEVLSGEETLSASAREQLFSEVKLQVEQAGAGYRLEEALSAALKGQATGTLTEQGEYVSKMLAAGTTSGADRSTQLSVMERAIESLTELSESARVEMKEQVREGLQKSTDERIGSLVRDAVTRSTDESSAIAELKGVLSTQADKSSEALREMSVTVDRELKSSGRFEGEQIATILREVERGVKEATSEVDRREAWESVSTAVPEARRSAYEGVQIPLPWQAPAATQRLETPSYASGFWSEVSAGLNNLLFSKAGAAPAPADQTLNIEPLQVSVDGTASAMTAFNGGLTSTLGATTSLTSSLTAAGAGAEALGATSTAAQGGIEALSASSAGATSGVDGLSASSSGATSSIDGLGAAASGAIGALLSAASSAGSAISAAASSAWSGLTSAVGSLLPGHAEGGIFPRGAHLTWFAEESAEAAIPLDNSKRSKGLWTQVGEMMGILPTVKETPQPESIMSGSRVKLPFGLKLPSRKKTTPGVPPEVREPKGQLPEALERYESIDREMRTYSSAAPSTTSVSEAMTAPITVNITFNGTVDREETKSGVMEGLEAMLERLNHERSRRAYA